MNVHSLALHVALYLGINEEASLTLVQIDEMFGYEPSKAWVAMEHAVRLGLFTKTLEKRTSQKVAVYRAGPTLLALKCRL